MASGKRSTVHPSNDSPEPPMGSILPERAQEPHRPLDYERRAPQLLGTPRNRVPNGLHMKCGRLGMGQVDQPPGAGTKLVIPQ